MSDKVKSLSREAKLRLLDLIEERKRRDRLRPNHYTPNSGQKLVHECQSVERYVFSGNGAGKTALLANEAIWAAEGYNQIAKSYSRVPCRVVVVLDKPEKVQEVWLQELRKWTAIKDEQLFKDGKPYHRRVAFQNGSQITFMFHEQEDMSFESIEADFFIFDEPPPRRHYIALKRGGRTKGRIARYLMGGTPLAAPWLRTEVYEPWSRGERPDTTCFRFGTEVNRDNLADGYIEKFSAVLSEKERRIRLEGEFFDLDGLALAHLFKRRSHVVNGPATRELAREKGWPCILACDPHPEKPNHAILLGVDPRTGYLYVLNEWKRRSTARDFAKAAKGWIDGYRMVDLVCDNWGSGHTTGGEGFRSFIEVAREEGLRIRPTRYDEKSDDAFIERIQEALLPLTEGTETPMLRVSSDCTGTIGDFENVEWVKYRDLDMHKPKLNISNRDYLACVKYALAANPGRHKGGPLKIIRAGAPANFVQRSKNGLGLRRRR